MFWSNQIQPLVTLLGFLTDDSLELPEGRSLLSRFSWFSTLTMEFSFLLLQFSVKRSQINIIIWEPVSIAYLGPWWWGWCCRGWQPCWPSPGWHLWSWSGSGSRPPCLGLNRGVKLFIFISTLFTRTSDKSKLWDGNFEKNWWRLKTNKCDTCYVIGRGNRNCDGAVLDMITFYLPFSWLRSQMFS